MNISCKIFKDSRVTAKTKAMLVHIKQIKEQNMLSNYHLYERYMDNFLKLNASNDAINGMDISLNVKVTYGSILEGACVYVRQNKADLMELIPKWKSYSFNDLMSKDFKSNVVLKFNIDENIWNWLKKKHNELAKRSVCFNNPIAHLYDTIELMVFSYYIYVLKNEV